MSNSLGIVRIPTRFEPLRDVVGKNQVTQVLIRPEDDVKAIGGVIADVQSAGQGKLVFLLGKPGVGKTSLAELLPVYLTQSVGDVITSPLGHDLSLVQLPGWIASQVKNANDRKKITVINLDGRENLSPSQAETEEAMVNLNGLLRRTPNLLLTWPVIREDFAQNAIKQLELVGGTTALSKLRIISVKGVPKDQYLNALKLILTTTNVSLQDAAISENEVSELVDKAENLGTYLELVSDLVVKRYDFGELSLQLPRVSFVISSNTDVHNHCRFLRRGNGYLIDPDRLLQNSKANVADDWRNRGAANARHSLAFIAAVLEARLLSLSSSAVVNCCGFSDQEDLKKAVREKYVKPVSSNSWNALENCSLTRHLLNQSDTGRSGSAPSEAVTAAYSAIQSLSKTRHSAINKSILDVIAKNIPNLANPQYEKRPVNGKELRVDVWFDHGPGLRPETLEFTHREDASEAVISTYVLQKLQDYARDYNLI